MVRLGLLDLCASQNDETGVVDLYDGQRRLGLGFRRLSGTCALSLKACSELDVLGLDVADVAGAIERRIPWVEPPSELVTYEPWDGPTRTAPEVLEELHRQRVRLEKHMATKAKR